MSRTLSATNIAQVDAAHLEEVVLVKLEFDTPVYAHSSVGTISYDGNNYTGVGDFGNISEARESEQLGPSPITLTLNGVDSTLISEGLDSGNFGDVITVYIGYRKDDGTLHDDPWIAWKGWYDSASISRGADNSISINAQHDLSMLDEKDGGRFTDEDHQATYSGDIFFEFIHEMATAPKKLTWGRNKIYGPPSTYPYPDPIMYPQ